MKELELFARLCQGYIQEALCSGDKQAHKEVPTFPTSFPLNDTVTTPICLSETRNPSSLLRLIEKVRHLLRFAMCMYVCVCVRVSAEEGGG